MFKSKSCRLISMLFCVLLVQSCTQRMFLPSVDEEARLMESNLKGVSHIAVVTVKGDSTPDMPSFYMGDPIAQAAAKVLENELGIKTTSMDHSSGGEFHQEFQRIADNAGIFTAESFEEFFLQRGFDAYLAIHAREGTICPVCLLSVTSLPAEKRSAATFPRNVTPREETQSYNPIFQLFTFDSSRKEIRIMSTVPNPRRRGVDCRKMLLYPEPERFQVYDPEGWVTGKVSGFIIEPDSCAQMLADRLSEAIAVRLNLMDRP